jgi:ADP-heptose:LPS heptosyltransferase
VIEPSPPLDPSGRRVAVLRALPGLGDLLCSVPALRSLRAGLPHACITLIGLPSSGWFVERFHGYIDELMELPAWPGLAEVPGDPAAALDFLVRAQARRFDLALQLHGSGTVTNGLVAMLGARAAAGHHSSDGWCPDAATFRPWPDAGTEVERLARLVRGLGFPDTGNDLELPIGPEDERARERLERCGLLGPAPFAVVHPGGVSGRRWPPADFAAVVDLLAGRGLTVLLTGTAAEVSVTAAVAAAARAATRDLAGRTSLGAMATIVRDATIVVCNDTGISHLSAALGTPSVVVFQGSEARRWAPLERTRHRAVTAGGRGAVLKAADELLARTP